MIPHKCLDTPRDTGQYIVAGPKTFRLACRKVLSNKRDTDYNNFGGNRQNIEKSMRKIFVADKGYKLINRDQSGADALIVAYLCRHGRYRELFQNDIKPHAYIALKYFAEIWKQKLGSRELIDIAISTPIPELKNFEHWKRILKLIKDSDKETQHKYRYYYFGKKVGHSGNYGMMGNKLITTILEETGGMLVLNKETADKWITDYHVLFPEIQRDFQSGVAKAAKSNNQLRNLLNFPFNITNKIVDSDMKDLYAWIPQSTVAGVNRRAWNLMQDYIEVNEKDWHLLTDQHDAIMMEAPENEADECAVQLGDFLSMELTSPVDGVKFKTKSECQMGYNWYEMEEVKI